MAAFEYTAKRKVMSGHTAGLNYSFDVGLTKSDYLGDADKSTSKSLGGVRETYLSVIEEGYGLRTIPVLENSNEHKQIKEFFFSVLGGETFMFDRYGTVAVPDDPVEFSLNDAKYSEEREGVSNYIAISFNIRQRIAP